MKLELDPTDLKPEFQTGKGNSVDQKCSTIQVSFYKLNRQAQAAVCLVGRATFYAWDRQTYEAIYSPGEPSLGYMFKNHGVSPAELLKMEIQEILPIYEHLNHSGRTNHSSLVCILNSCDCHTVADVLEKVCDGWSNMERYRGMGKKLLEMLKVSLLHFNICQPDGTPILPP